MRGRTDIYDPIFEFGLIDFKSILDENVYDEAMNEWNQMIKNDGTLIGWEKAIRCPCKSEKGEPEYDCDYCHGIGYQYIDALDEDEEMYSIIQSRNVKATKKEFGWVDTGTCTMIWPSYKIPGIWDKIVEEQEVTIITDSLLTRGKLSRTGKSLEKVRYNKILKVEICVDDEGNRYREGADFDIFKSRYIKWRSSARIKDGVQYSLRYQARPEYIIMDAEPIFRRHTDYILPFRAIAKRFENLMDAD